MRTRTHALVCGLAILLGSLVVPAVSRGQTTEPILKRGKNEIGIWGGGSVAATPLIGTTSDFDFGLAALRYGRRLWENEALSFDWTVDVVPLAILSLDRSPSSAGTEHDAVYGAGLAPIGFRISYDALDWCRPYFAASGGFLAFAERVPAAGAKFNFTYDFGVGAQIPLTARTAATIGYSYYHISNGDIADSNPGFDANLLYVGFSLFR